MIIWIIVVCLLLSALFSGMEIAFVSANKLKIELDRQKGAITGRIISHFSQRPSLFIGAMLIGNNIALVIFGIYMALALEPSIHQMLPTGLNVEFSVLLIQTLISTLLILLVGEFLPKAIFRLNPNGILRVFAIPVQVIYWLLFPFVIIVIWLSRLFLKLFFRVDDRDTDHAFSKVDLEHFVKETSGNVEEDTEINTELFQNALYLIKVKARECMVPRNEIETVDVSTGIEELRLRFIESKVSRLVVYNESIDHILGYVHHQSLLEKPPDIQSILFTMPVVPETMPASDILQLLIRNQKNIAYVVDEFGGTAGIVTLEDILEEIFGEIIDEHDEEEYIEQQIAEKEYIFSGRLEIDYVNEKYHLTLPEGEYETIAGLILDRAETIPQHNEKLVVENYEFTILHVSDTRVESVKLRELEEYEGNGSG